MRKPPGRLESLFTIAVLLMTIISAVAAMISLYRYRQLSAMAEAGARFAAVHGKASDAVYMRPYGTTAQIIEHLRRTGPAFPFAVDVRPGEPNTLSPGTPVTVTVSAPWEPLTRISAFSGLMLSSSATQSMLN